MKKFFLLAIIFYSISCKSQEIVNNNYNNCVFNSLTDSLFMNADSSIVDSLNESVERASMMSERGSKLMIIGTVSLVGGVVISATPIVVGAGLVIVIGEIYHIVSVRKFYDSYKLITFKKNNRKNKF